jgi:hypothetical protein
MSPPQKKTGANPTTHAGLYVLKVEKIVFKANLVTRGIVNVYSVA